jgi:hypothetical protein
VHAYQFSTSGRHGVTGAPGALKLMSILRFSRAMLARVSEANTVLAAAEGSNQSEAWSTKRLRGALATLTRCHTTCSAYQTALQSSTRGPGQHPEITHIFNYAHN